MNIPLFTSAGQKKGTLNFPTALFADVPNHSLMHQAVVLQQSNRRVTIAHAKTRGEVVGSTKKAYQQKGTGRARRGPIRSPIVRGGGKTFGPRNDRNFLKCMPRRMRHAALRSCLGMQAKREAVLALESYPETVKTKDFSALLKKLPVDLGRHILIITADAHRGIALSSRNIPGVKAIMASYLNPEDILRSRHVIFLQDALKRAEEMFGKKQKKQKKASTSLSSASSASSDSSVSSS